jgi:hypothetical protein
MRAIDKVFQTSAYTLPISAIHRDYLAPEPPLNLKAVTISPFEIELSWLSSPSSDVEGYLIYMYEDKDGLNKQYNMIDKTNTTLITIRGLKENTTYNFAVCAFDEADNPSIYSNETFNKTQVKPTAPLIIDTFPVNNAKDVDINTNVVLTFNVPMITKGALDHIKADPSAVFDLSWDDEKKVVTIDFDKPLKYNTAYTISVGEISAENKQVFADAPYDLSFTTEAELIIPPPKPSITVTYPSNNTVFRTGEFINVTGTSTGFKEGEEVSISILGKMYFGTIDADGNWSITIRAPPTQGEYVFSAWLGPLEDVVFILVEEESLEPIDTDKDSAEDDKGMLYIGAAFGTIFAVIIILGILIMLRKKKGVWKEKIEAEKLRKKEKKEKKEQEAKELYGADLKRLGEGKDEEELLE